LKRTSQPLREGRRRRGYRRISKKHWSDRFKCRVGASKEWLTTRQILAVPRVENVDVKNKSGRNELAFPVQGTCWEKRLKENIIFRRSRRKVRASCRRCQARGTARDSGAMTSIESPSCSFLTRQPHSPNDRLFNPIQTLTHNVGSGKERCQGSWQGCVEITRPAQTRRSIEERSQTGS
jgi:hypothetical protein